jgi:hypothetical protein
MIATLIAASWREAQICRHRFTLYAGSWSLTRRKRLHKNVNEPLISSKLGANQPDGNKNLLFAQSL